MGITFYRKRPSRKKQIWGLLLFSIFIMAYMWLVSFNWTAIIPLVLCVVYGIARDWGAKYILKDNGDLILRPGIIRFHKKIANVKDIDTIEYAPQPGQVSIMFHSQQGFVFANPEKPEEMIHAIKQLNPAIQVEVIN